MKNLLLIAYHFPPVRVSSGIQRMLKFSLRFDYAQSLVSLLEMLRKARRRTDNEANKADEEIAKVDEGFALPIRMRESETLRPSGFVGQRTGFDRRRVQGSRERR